VVALIESAVSAAEVGGVGDDFAVMREEYGPLQLGKRLHTWSGQQLAGNRWGQKSGSLCPFLVEQRWWQCTAVDCLGAAAAGPAALQVEAATPAPVAL